MSDIKIKASDDSGQESAGVNARKIEFELSQQEVTQLRELRTRDREVRAHEQAHASVAGSLARGGPSYEYQRGPDGRQYAVGGSVSIDTSAVSGDPQATLAKAQQIKRAALAPAQPSSQDRAVAAAATALEANARAELSQKSQDEEVDPLSGLSALEEREEANQITREQNIEKPLSCAECGGQHSSHSHDAAILIGESYAQQSPDNFFEATINIEV
ncbi:MAG: putative metalloprotease CJM1_0395 family protein [Gammaproteobacteria bacterium]